MMGRIAIGRLSQLRLVAMFVVTGMTVIGLGFASSAFASDTFTLQNNSTYTLWSFAGPQPCATGMLAATSTESPTLPPGASSSITFSDSPFSSCLGTWPFGDDPDGSEYGAGGGIEPSSGTTPQWTFTPDDPSVGSPSLACSDNQYMAPYVEMSSSGLTCTATNTSSTPTINVISSAAFTDDPKYALLTVELFAKNRLAAAHVEVTLTRQGASTDKQGPKQARPSVDVGHEELLVGWPELITVPLDQATRQILAKGKEVKMRAVVGRDDGGRGKGDSKMLVVREYRGDTLR
jgi:hypothetical protein